MNKNIAFRKLLPLSCGFATKEEEIFFKKIASNEQEIATTHPWLCIKRKNKSATNPSIICIAERKNLHQTNKNLLPLICGFTSKGNKSPTNLSRIWIIGKKLHQMNKTLQPLIRRFASKEEKKLQQFFPKFAHIGRKRCIIRKKKLLLRPAMAAPPSCHGSTTPPWR